MEYSIYRLKDTESLSPLRFLGSASLKGSDWWPVEPENYERIYASSCAVHDHTNVLEAIFAKFNLNPPKNFKHYSLSVGDIVVLNGKKSGAFFCDNIGWTEIPEFFKEVSA